MHSDHGTDARDTGARRPGPGALAAAADRTVADVLGPRLSVLLCGINPGLWSAWSGLHFARPGNRFWPALHRSGFTPRQLRPDEQDCLPGFGLGITNLVARASARADEVTRDELRAGAERLAALAGRLRPDWIAVLGVTAYRAAFGPRGAAVGEQPGRIGPSRIWVLPNPSGLNAHYTLDALTEQFRALQIARRPGS